MRRARAAVATAFLIVLACALAFWKVRHHSAGGRDSGPTAAEPISLRAPSGTVRTAAGAPAARAQVLLVSPQTPVNLYDQIRPKAPAVKTDNAGHFAFDAVDANWKAIVVRCSDGFACVGVDELPADGTITLSPWGRIEGTILGSGDTSDRQIQISPWPYANEFAGLGIDFGRQIPALPGGHFQISRVAPGEMIVSSYAQSRGIYGRVQGNRQSAYVALDPGETAQVTLNAPGVRIKGRAVLASADPTVYMLGTLAPVAARIASPLPATWDKMSRQQRAEWRAREGHTLHGRAASEAKLRRPFSVSRDGTFEIDNVPAGANRVHLTAYAFQPGSSYTNLAAAGQKEFTAGHVPASANGSQAATDSAVDLGKIELKPLRWLKVHAPAPAMDARAAGGGMLHLSDFAGKSVLLVIDPADDEPAGPDPFNGDVLADHFAGMDGLVLIHLSRSKPTSVSKSVGNSAWINARFPDSAAVPEEYADPKGLVCMIAPDGTVSAKYPFSERDAYFALDAAHEPACAGIGGVKVLAEHNDGNGATPSFKFPSVPTLSKEDAGQNAIFTIVDGRKADYGGAIRVLNDGLGPHAFDDETGMMAFANGSLEGRIGVDLKRAIAIDQINTYSWYRHGNRWPQVYRVYASDGSAAGFNPAPRIGVDPAKCGWTPIAWVDTRPMAGGVGLHDGMVGQDGVSIRGEHKVIGKYRYLIFLIFATEPHDEWCQTFWSEIDVVEKK
ncbi:MAG TPA: hypothetical protein VFC78_04730 [Tepidisphaeraceae bacterium]|nr:hypothetical protein [Tepidisphaeraceae bacterium]